MSPVDVSRWLGFVRCWRCCARAVLQWAGRARGLPWRARPAAPDCATMTCSHECLPPALRCCYGALIPASSPPAWWTGWRRSTGCSAAGCRQPLTRPYSARALILLVCACRRSGLPALVPCFGAGLYRAVRPSRGGPGRGAAASRGQFLAMARLQARFLDRVRGIATIVLAGRTAEDEPPPLGRSRGRELRQRTMRVLRVAFLSSAALDCAMAGSPRCADCPARPRGTGRRARLGHCGALFSLLLVPEFFAPAARLSPPPTRTVSTPRVRPKPWLDLPALRRRRHRKLRCARSRRAASRVAFEGVRLVWDASRGHRHSTG